jgi:hypothetical protein
MPIAAPLALAGATREMSEGRVASSTLNATKNTASNATTATMWADATISPISVTASKAIADRKTAFIAPRRSAATMAGTMNAKLTISTGR